MPFINGIGPGELIIILIIALIVVGPGKLPDVGASLGKSIREFRKAATDVKESVSLEPTAPAASAPLAPAPAVPVAAAPSPPAPITMPPAPVAAAVAAVGAVAVEAAPAVAVEAAPAVAVEAAPAAAPKAPAEAAPAEWPAEVTPVDEQQPTASA
jgi:TatA/E family protein of Tat protein translocase